jgi:hypothetical protein
MPQTVIASDARTQTVIAYDSPVIDQGTVTAADRLAQAVTATDKTAQSVIATDNYL